MIYMMITIPLFPLPSLACVTLSVVCDLITDNPSNLLLRGLVALDVVDGNPPDFAI